MNKVNLRKTLNVFLEMNDSDDIPMCSEIKALGFKAYDAERIVAFLPIAFCRVALSHKFDIEFADVYRIKNSDDEFSFQNEPVYKAAIELGSHIYHHEEDLAESFNTIAMRSSEFNVVNQALNNGTDIAGAKLSAPLYFGYKTLGKKQSVLSKLFS